MTQTRSSNGSSPTDEPTEKPTTKAPRIAVREGLSRAHWKEWHEGSGRRGKFQESGIETRNYGLFDQHAAYSWDLGLKGEIRYCSGCGLDLSPGETLVRPAIIGNGYKRKDWEPSDRLAYHTRCVPPEMWHKWLGAPRASTHRAQRPDRAKRTDATFQAAIDEGWLVLEDGVSVSDAVDAVRKAEGQNKLTRKVKTS